MKTFKNTKELSHKIRNLLVEYGIDPKESIYGPFEFNENHYEIQIEDEINTFVIHIENVSLLANKKK